MFTNEIEKRRFQEKHAEAIQTNNFSKLAADMSPYIKVRVYENSVCTGIMRSRTITAADLIPEPGHNDTFFVYGSLDQMTKDAIAVNFRGQGATFVPGGRRFKIPLGRHMSKVTKKPQDELLAWDYDLFSDLNEKDVFELHTLRDQKFLNACQAAVISSTKWTEYPLTGSNTVVRPDKLHFSENAQLLESGSRTGMPTQDTLKATKHLMGSQLWHDLNLWESEGAGGAHVSQVTINGYPATRIMGIDYLTSVKNVLYVQRDPVIQFTMTDVGINNETIVIDGITYTWKTSPGGVVGDREVGLGTDATTAATALYDKLVTDKGQTSALGNEFDFSNPSAGVVRIRKIYDANWSRFGVADFATSETATNGSFGTLGYDIWDHIYTYPEADYLGEIVQIQGMEIETDLWKERGEKLTEVCRRSTEFSGGAIGNIQAIAMSRLQRFKYAG